MFPSTCPGDSQNGPPVNLTNAVMKPILGLQILDVLSTNLMLANGGWEANPLGVWAIANMGVWWWLPKLAVMLVCTLVMSRWRLRFVVAAMAISDSCIDGDVRYFVGLHPRASRCASVI
jgi:Domain of unknown function (DUF5658)